MRPSLLLRYLADVHNPYCQGLEQNVWFRLKLEIHSHRVANQGLRFLAFSADAQLELLRQRLDLVPDRAWQAFQLVDRFVISLGFRRLGRSQIRITIKSDSWPLRVFIVQLKPNGLQLDMAQVVICIHKKLFINDKWLKLGERKRLVIFHQVDFFVFSLDVGEQRN